MELVDLLIVWVVAYLLAVGLFAIVRRYLANMNEETAEPTGGSQSTAQPIRERAKQEASESDREICTACGSENDPFYTYCRNCLTSLDADATSAISY